MRFTRDFYRPKNSRVESPAGLPDGYEIHRYENGSPYAAVFGGKRAKPDWHYRFKTAESREAKIAEWVESQKAHLEYAKKRRKEMNKPHDFKPGQLFYASWGYDQTNIDYYKLEKLKGKTMGYIVPIGAKTMSSKPPCDMVAPNPEYIREWDVLLGVNREDEEKGKWKRLRPDGFTLDHTSASPCSADTEKYETSSGWGH
jgi:hypothetical protein